MNDISIGLSRKMIEGDLPYERYMGVVESIDDPKKIGRCKIRVFNLHDSEVKTDHLPWVMPKYSLFFGKDGKCGAISIPKVGAVVNVEFDRSNQYAPEYYHLQQLAPDVIQDLTAEYDGVHVFAYDGDEDLKMYYTPNTGLTFYLQGSRVNIGADRAIMIEHKDSSSMIELRGGTVTIVTDSEINQTAGTSITSNSKEVWCNGKVTKVGPSPQYSAVLGEPLMNLLNALAVMIDAKLPPTINTAVSALEMAKKLILSKNVKISM